MEKQDYWSHRCDELFPNGLTQEQIDEANAQMWKGAYPTLEMAQEQEEQERASRVSLE